MAMGSHQRSFSKGSCSAHPGIRALPSSFVYWRPTASHMSIAHNLPSNHLSRCYVISMAYVASLVSHLMGLIPFFPIQAVYKPYLCQQFSVAYDLYLDIWRHVDERVMNALGRDSSWRLKHACPACMYKLEGEDKLIFDMLTTMDGNDSLKQVLQREKGTMADAEGGEPMLVRSSERVDNQDVGDGYYISRKKVDRWAKTRLGEMLPMQTGTAVSPFLGAIY